jgi:hypothetical protein
MAAFGKFSDDRTIAEFANGNLARETISGDIKPPWTFLPTNHRGHGQPPPDKLERFKLK